MDLKAFLLLTVLSLQVHALERGLSDLLSWQIDYKNVSTELCLIGAHYDTDKSSQRKNISPQRHCHPYTIFYEALFHEKRDCEIAIAELGILKGASLLMWRDYFRCATIDGFDCDTDYIQSFRESYDQDRIRLFELDVSNKSSILSGFQKAGRQYDLIIDDTSHEFGDQIRVIQTVHPFLKPGGMLIIEDLFKNYIEEKFYICKLKSVLDQFQDLYFVTLDHKNRESTGWDNDKLLVLVKGGADPIFKSSMKMTIITPCKCISHLPLIKESIDFDHVDEWIIVYEQIGENPHVFNHEKIKEYVKEDFALDRVQNEKTWIYFLDDDHKVHPDLYKLLPLLGENRVVTFNDAMTLIDYRICKSKDRFPDHWIHVNRCLTVELAE